MHLTEERSCKMEFCEDDIKIEEVSIGDEEEFSDCTSVTSSEDRALSQNMIFTQIYIPKQGAMQEYLASPSPSDMNYKNRPGRKQKLEHLTFEEKLMRKKLKNREAAQTSRDRKKARMTELEMKVRYLQEQNERMCSRMDSVCKENELLKLKLTELSDPPASQSSPHPTKVHPAPISRCNAAATRPTPAAERVTSRIKRESAEFLELSPQKTSGSMQSATRPPSPVACVANLKQEVVSMVSMVATLLLVVVMSSQPAGQKPKSGTGSWILRRAQLQSAFSNLSSSQQVYLSQLLLIIAKELKQAPVEWNPQAPDWNPVNFLHSNVPLFLQHIPPLPTSCPLKPPSLPSLAALVEASMKKVPVPS